MKKILFFLLFIFIGTVSADEIVYDNLIIYGYEMSINKDAPALYLRDTDDSTAVQLLYDDTTFSLNRGTMTSTSPDDWTSTETMMSFDETGDVSFSDTLTAESLCDDDKDTCIFTEQSADEDIIRFDAEGIGNVMTIRDSGVGILGWDETNHPSSLTVYNSSQNNSYGIFNRHVVTLSDDENTRSRSGSKHILLVSSNGYEAGGNSPYSGITGSATWNGLGSNSVNHLSAMSFSTDIAAFGQADNVYGIKISHNTDLNASITDYYGLHIGLHTGSGTITNRFGVFQADADATNIMKGVWKASGYYKLFVEKTAAYTVEETDDIIYCSSGTFTVTLLDANDVVDTTTFTNKTSGKVYEIVNAGDGIITIDGDGSDKINGLDTYILNPSEKAEFIAVGGSTWVAY